MREREVEREKSKERERERERERDLGLRSAEFAIKRNKPFALSQLNAVC